MKFLDQAKIYVRSGNGGAGSAGPMPKMPESTKQRGGPE